MYEEFLKLAVREESGAVIARLNEKKYLDAKLIQDTGEELLKLLPLAACGKKLVVDFAEVTYMSSAMLVYWIRLGGGAKHMSIQLKLCAVAVEMFVTTRTDKSFDFKDDCGQALASFSR